MKKQIATTAAAMAVTALMAFQPMTAFAATGNCGNGSYNTGCSTQVCQSYGCNTRNCGQNSAACGKNGSSCNTAAGNCATSGNCSTGCNTGLAGISRKGLSGKNCSSPQMISYVMGNSSCRR